LEAAPATGDGGVANYEAPAAAAAAGGGSSADEGSDAAAAEEEGGAVAAKKEGAAAAEEEEGAAAAEEEEGEGGGDLEWTRWNPIPPWPAVFSTLRVPRTRDFAYLPAAQSLAIMFFFRDDLRKEFTELNNDIFQGWQASYGRCITVEGLNLLPTVGPAAMSDVQQNWCRETIEFYEKNLNDEQRDKLGLQPRKKRRSRDPALKPAGVTGDERGLRRQTLEAAEVSDDELDARRKKVAAGKGGKHHRKTLVDAAPTPKAAARAPTTPARAGRRPT